MLHNHDKLKERRRELRQKSTKEEEILWKQLRGNKLGYKFKRQHSIGGYILDFYCSKIKLIIEIDGTSHLGADAKEYDEIRDKYFSELGYKTVRFSNNEVENDLEEVLNKIRTYLPHPNPLLEKARDLKPKS